MRPEDLAALIRLHDRCEQNALCYTIEYTECDGGFCLDVRGAGINEHWHVKRRSCLEHAVEAIEKAWRESK